MFNKNEFQSLKKHYAYSFMFHHRIVYQRQKYRFDSGFDKMHVTLEFV